jgi:hypothetical protein
MKSGIEQIQAERQKQIDKYGFTGEHHAQHPEWYDKGQLIEAARTLTMPKILSVFVPINWDAEWFERLCQRPFQERIVIAAALLASELDRQNNLPKNEA